VTDSIGPESLLGGVATALIVATLYAKKYDYRLRIITRNAVANPKDYQDIMTMNDIVPVNDVEFYSDFERKKDGQFDTKLEVHEKDVFFATSWWSATAIRKTFPRVRFFYILQEVETFFYPHGDSHLLCNEILADANIRFIVNSQYLWEYFSKNNPKVTANGTWFEPAFSKKLYYPKEFIRKEKYRLFFYGRPNNPRNLYYFGLQMIHQAIESGILDPSQWEMVMAGGEGPSIEFTKGIQIKNLGMLTWDQYGELLRNTDLALSLMYTPHPSYPPFDAAVSGSVVLSNQCLNKTDFPYCENVILSDVTEEKFLASFREAVSLAKDHKKREKNWQEASISTNWKQTLEAAVKWMEVYESDK
ncbi:MAG: hypothetical protein GX786_06275, partial [Clostridiales bacterium]|nr:hypothetical protein [Clostridiales bacterium]